MPIEYLILAASTILFMFAWLPVSVGKKRSFGISWLASNRDPLPLKELAPWAARCERALFKSQGLFPRLYRRHSSFRRLNKFDEGTKWAALVYVIARIGHYTAHGMGNFPVRFASYLMAVTANLFLLLKVFF